VDPDINGNRCQQGGTTPQLDGTGDRHPFETELTAPAGPTRDRDRALPPNGPAMRWPGKPR
jgi:hypothetical protein